MQGSELDKEVLNNAHLWFWPPIYLHSIETVTGRIVIEADMVVQDSTFNTKASRLAVSGWSCMIAHDPATLFPINYVVDGCLQTKMVGDLPPKKVMKHERHSTNCS